MRNPAKTQGNPPQQRRAPRTPEEKIIDVTDVPLTTVSRVFPGRTRSIGPPTDHNSPVANGRRFAVAFEMLRVACPRGGADAAVGAVRHRLRPRLPCRRPCPRRSFFSGHARKIFTASDPLQRMRAVIVDLARRVCADGSKVSRITSQTSFACGSDVQRAASVGGRPDVRRASDGRAVRPESQETASGRYTHSTAWITKKKYTVTARKAKIV